MRCLIAILAVAMVLSSCSIDHQEGNISFTIDKGVDSVNITITSYSSIEPILSYSYPSDVSTFQILPGEYQISITSPGQKKHSTDFFIEEGTPVLEVAVEISEADGRLGINFSETKQTEYAEILRELGNFRKELFQLNMFKTTKEQLTDHYKVHVAKLDSLQKKHSVTFDQIFKEEKLSHLSNFHPLTALFKEAGMDGVIDSLDIYGIYTTETFTDYFETFHPLIDAIDPASIYLDGTFIIALGRLEVFEGYLLADDRIHIAYFNFLIDMLSESPNAAAVSNALFNKAGQYLRDGNSENARFLIHWLEDDYSSSRYVQSGESSALKKGIAGAKNVEVTPFSFTNLSGENIDPFDSSNYVFIEFFASWCKPCLNEIDHLNKLFHSEMGKSVDVYGLSIENLNVLEKYGTDNHVAYALGHIEKDVTEVYGITGYPTSILVSPSGEIVKKHLRGNQIATFLDNYFLNTQ